jgi:hypothetical protein
MRSYPFTDGQFGAQFYRALCKMQLELGILQTLPPEINNAVESVSKIKDPRFVECADITVAAISGAMEPTVPQINTIPERTLKTIESQKLSSRVGKLET